MSSSITSGEGRETVGWSPSPAEWLLDGFVGYLRGQRGVSARTVEAYVSDVRRFLARRGWRGVDELSAAEVSEAVLGEMESRSPASVRRYGCALRAFLRYCHVTGLNQTDLSAAVLPVSGRRRSLLPQGISPAQERALLRAGDRRRGTGRRDYAVIVLMLRLGLRASEVAVLALDDLEWRAGLLTVHGKRAQVDQLPLPVDVGEGAGGVRAGDAAVGRADPTRGDEHRCRGRAAGRAGHDTCPSTSAHRGLRHVARWSLAGRDRPGASAPLGGRDRGLCPGGYRAAAPGCAALAGRGEIMSALAEHLADYLRMRRALGFELGRHGQVLPGFVAYLEAAGASRVTVELAVAWARQPERIKPITVSQRLSTVRGFARYLQAIDPATEVPPPGLLAVPRRRPAPYLYSPDEIVLLLATTRRLRPPLRAATYRR